MPRINGWKKVKEDYGIANKHVWEHKEGMELMLYENKQSEGWSIMYPDGDEEPHPTKKDGLEEARNYIKHHPLPEDKYGMFDDVMFKIVLPTSYNNGGEIPQEELDEYLYRIAERFGGFTEHDVNGGWSDPDRGGVQREQNIQVVFGRKGEDGVPINEDEDWLRALADQATEDFGQAQVMIQEDPDIEIEFVNGTWEEDGGGTAFS